MIELQPWTEEDKPLLVRLNAPEMTEHLAVPRPRCNDWRMGLR